MLVSPMRNPRPLLPEHPAGCHAGLGVGPLCDDSAGDVPEAVDQIGKPAVDIVHGITFRASVSDVPRIGHPAEIT